jgi:hypothetical protein
VFPGCDQPARRCAGHQNTRRAVATRPERHRPPRTRPRTTTNRSPPRHPPEEPPSRHPTPMTLVWRTGRVRSRPTRGRSS